MNDGAFPAALPDARPAAMTPAHAVTALPLAARPRASFAAMTSAVFSFELRYQLRAPLFTVACVLFFLMAFMATATENVTIGEPRGNLNFNATYVMLNSVYVLSMIAMLLAMAFAATPMTRDDELRTAALFNATPLRRMPFLLGRFSAAYLITLLAVSASVLGALVGGFAPWLDPQRLQPFHLLPYAYAVATAVAPNTFIQCAFFFSLAALFRNMMAVYLGAVAAIALQIMLAANTDAETLGRTALLDPFGYAAFGFVTRYWSVFEKNQLVPAITGVLLWNRVIWLSIAGLGLGVAMTRFKFRHEPARQDRKQRKVSVAAREQHNAPLRVADTTSLRSPRAPQISRWQSFLSQLRLDLSFVFTGAPFILLLLFGVANVYGGISGTITEAFGTPVYPLTGALIPVIAGSFGLMVLLVVAYYAAELVHRERDFRIRDVIDATAIPGGVIIAAKITALLLVVIAMLLVAMLTGMAYQLIHGFTRLQPEVYLLGIFVSLGAGISILVPLAVFLQVLVNHKYGGMLAFTLLFFAFKIADSAGFEHALYQYDIPSMKYSDMNGYSLYLTQTLLLCAYWFCGALLLCIGAHLLWVRGLAGTWRDRIGEAARRWQGGVRVLTVAVAAVFIALGAFIFYNTNVLTIYRTAEDLERLQANYEKRYKQFARASQPDIVDMDVQMDVFPIERRVESRGRMLLKNLHSAPLGEMQLNVPDALRINHLHVTGATETARDAVLGVYRFRFSKPLAAGETATLVFDLTLRNDGYIYGGGGPNPRVIANGTLFESTDVMPLPGYNRGRELLDNAKRRKYGLPPATRANAIGDVAAHAHSMFTVSGRTNYHAVLSTSGDQIAMTSGYLQRQWRQGDRAFFEYRMDKPIWPYVSVSSGRYAEKRDRTRVNGQDVALEIYYDARHAWNLNSMIQGAKESLNYFSREFSPYQYRQFRILEFPSYRLFAEALPNTVPFSEGIGFVADLTDKKYIDYVLYVTAHEAAHQWWGHQLAGADVQGVTMLSETLAQYSALMVMEHHFGREKMRRFLKYELDRYLKGRGGEFLDEMPLGLVEDQPYIHYRKGSLAMYALKDYLGEANVNSALKEFIQQYSDLYGGKGAPYPDTRDLITLFRARATPEQQTLITDLFEKVVLFDLRADKATLTRRADGQYLVTFDALAHKFVADGKGREHEVPMDQMLDVGVFSSSADLGEDDLPPVLAMARQRVHSGVNHFTIIVDSARGMPAKVGIDPLNIMIDKTPNDNVMALGKAA